MSLVTGGAPKEALQPKQPSAQQTVAIRTAYANANLPATESTAVIQDPTAAQAVYGSIAQQSQPTSQEPTQPTETTTTTFTAGRARLDQNSFLVPQESFTAGRARLSPNSFEVPTSYYSGGGRARLDPNSFIASESYYVGMGRARLDPNSFIIPPKDFTTGNPVLDFIIGPLNRVSVLQTLGTEIQTSIETTPIIGPTFARLATVRNYFQSKNAPIASNIINTLGTFAQRSSVGYQQTGESLLRSPNVAVRFVGGLSMEAAGFSNLFALSLGRPNTQLQQTVPVLTGEAFAFGVQAFLAGEVLSSVEGATGIRNLSTVPKLLIRSQAGALIGGGQTLIQGGGPESIAIGAGLGAASFGLGSAVGESIAARLAAAREFLVMSRPDPSLNIEDPYQLSYFTRTMRTLFGEPTPIQVRSTGSVFGPLQRGYADTSGASAFARSVTDRLGTNKIAASEEFSKYISDYGNPSSGGEEVNVGGGQVQVVQQEQIAQTVRAISESVGSSQTQTSLDIPRLAAPEAISVGSFAETNAAQLAYQKMLIRARSGRAPIEEFSTYLTTPARLIENQ